MLKALIFDVDGTLAETEEHHRLAFNQAFMLEGLDWYWDAPIYARLLAVTGGKERLRAFIEADARERLSDAARLAPRLHRVKTRLYTHAVAAGAIALRPGLSWLIDEARQAGLRLAIATTTSMPNVEALLRVALGPAWRDIFPIVVAGDMVRAKKPAPDAYTQALALLGVAPEEALAIEDSRNGVVAAIGAGLPVVGLRSLYCARDDLGGAAAIFRHSEDMRLDAIRAAHLDWTVTTGNTSRTGRAAPSLIHGGLR